ncbi:MAG TPA: Hsp20/alpha crystallin family protein [Candidatus Binatia bacterium]|nr:Hsp20/alpha crystallin family protein [Candidatus Binatia bacterium]
MTHASGLQPVPVKLYRALDHVTVAAPMPGLGPDDITAEVTAEGELVIEGRLVDLPGGGELKSNKEVLLDEWTAGPYHRQVGLPVPVDAQAATVTYGNGVLVVALPVARATRPARLRLETSTGPSRGAHVGTPGNVVHPTCSSSPARR